MNLCEFVALYRSHFVLLDCDAQRSNACIRTTNCTVNGIKQRSKEKLAQKIKSSSPSSPRTFFVSS